MSLLDEYAYSAAFEAGKKAIIDDYESDDLSKIGLTRLPKDADGVESWILSSILFQL